MRGGDEGKWEWECKLGGSDEEAVSGVGVLLHFRNLSPHDVEYKNKGRACITSKVNGSIQATRSVLVGA